MPLSSAAGTMVAGVLPDGQFAFVGVLSGDLHLSGLHHSHLVNRGNSNLYSASLRLFAIGRSLQALLPGAFSSFFVACSVCPNRSICKTAGRALESGLILLTGAGLQW